MPLLNQNMFLTRKKFSPTHKRNSVSVSDVFAALVYHVQPFKWMPIDSNGRAFK
jgi:hypothetical protein